MSINFSTKFQKLDSLDPDQLKNGGHFSFYKKPGFCDYFKNGKRYNFFSKKKKMRGKISYSNI